MRIARGLTLSVLLLAAGCGRTFQQPSTAPVQQPGAIDGRVDLQGHALDAHDLPTLTLSEPDGTALTQPLDPSAAFSFHGLADGTYALKVHINQNFQDVIVPLIAVRHDQTTHLGTLQPQWLLGLSGAAQPRLVGTVTANLHPDGGGLAADAGLLLGGTQVSIYNTGESTPLLVAFTDQQGNFGQQLPPGVYDLRASNPLFVDGRLTGLAVALDGGAENGVVLVPEAALVMDINPAKLTGVVMLEVNADLSDAGADDGGAFRVGSGVTVGTTFGGAGVSNANGVFTIANLLGKPDQAFFSAPVDNAGNHFHDPTAFHDVNLEPGQVTDLGAVPMLLDRGSIVGTVRMADGSPAVDVNVWLSGAPHPVSLSQDPNDPAAVHFRFDAVPARLGYVVNAARNRYAPAQVGGVNIIGDGTATDVGTLLLTLQSGDLRVSDLRPESSPGYSLTRDVFVGFLNTSGAQIAQARLGERSDFSLDDGGAADWLPFPPLDDAGNPDPRGYPFELSDADGTHDVYFQYRDASQVLSQVYGGQIVLDRLRPQNATVGLTSGKVFTRDAQNFDLALYAEDIPAAVGVSASGLRSMVVAVNPADAGDADGGALAGVPQAFAPTAVVATAPQPDGPVLLAAQYMDNAGNRSAITTSTVVVDTQAPAGNLILSAPGSSRGYASSPFIQVQELFALPDGGYDVTSHEPFGGFVTVYLANTDEANLATAAPLPVNSIQSWYLDAQGDGTKTVWMKLVDAAGNASPDYSATIVLDRAAPVVAVDLLAGGATDPAVTNQASANLRFTTSESPAPSFAVFSAPQDCASAQGYQPFPTGVPATTPVSLAGSDGPRNLYVCFKDPAGNTSLATVSTTFDATPPTAALTLGTGAAIQNQSALTLQLNASQDTAGMLVLQDPSSAPDCTSASGYVSFNPSVPLNFTDGAHVVDVCLRDAAGNSSALLSASVTIDTALPTLSGVAWSGLSNSAASATNAASVSVTFNGFSEPVTGYRLSTDSTFASVGFANFSADGSAVTGAQTVAFTLPGSDGSKTVYAQVLDRAGNASMVATLPAVLLDRVAPTATVHLVANSITDPAATNATAVNLQFSVSVDAAEYVISSQPLTCSSVPDASWTAISTPSFSAGATLLPPDGSKSLYTCVRDAAHNTVSTLNTVTLDQTVPSGTMVVGTGAAVQSLGSSVQVALSNLSSDVVGYAVSTSALNCATATYTSYSVSSSGSSTTYALALGTDGSYTVSGCLKDSAGNTAALPSFALTKDTTAPSCTLTLTGVSKNGVASLSTATASPTIGVTLGGCTDAADVAFSTSALSCTSPSVAWQSNTGSLSFTLPGTDATYTVYACVRDAAHNAAATTNTATMQLLQTAPQPGAFTLNSGATYLNALQIAQSGRVVSVSGSATNAATWAVQESSVPTSGFSAIGSGTISNFALSSGDGTKTVYAVFRDIVGNLSTPVSASITVDTVAPSGGPLKILSYLDGGYVSSVSATLNFNSVGDASTVDLAAVTGSACSSGNGLYADGGVNGQKLTPSTVMTTLLPSGDGTKAICAQLIDAAGNVGSVLSSSVVLDTTPPTAPVITTANQVVATATGGSFTVQTSGPVTESNFLRFEQTGGQLTSWTASSVANSGTPSFVFTLVGDSSNQLSLRAVDKAGNTSPESSVFITSEVTPPSAVSMSQSWVVNGNGSAQVYWQDTSTSHLSGFYVYYGGASGYSDGGGYNGSYASEGVSPIFVDVANGRANGTFSLTLDGLTNGTTTYVTVRAVDQAGNLSTLPSGTTQVALVPSEVALNELAVATVPGSYPSGLARVGDYLYETATSYGPSYGGSADGVTTLNVIDPGSLASAVQTGIIQDAGSSPSVVYTQQFSDALLNYEIYGRDATVIADGPFAYFASGQKLRILDVTVPTAPTVVTTLDLSLYTGCALHSLAVKGDKLFVGFDCYWQYASTTGPVLTLDLAKLFDHNAATLPTVYPDGGGDVVGSMVSGSWTVNWLAVGGEHLFSAEGVDLGSSHVSDAVDNDAGTPWNVSDRINDQYLYGDVGYLAVGGNLLYSTADSFSIFDTNTLQTTGQLTLLGQSSRGGYGQSAIAGSEVFMPAPTENGIAVIDISTPSAPTELGHVEPLLVSNGDQAYASVLMGDYLASTFDGYTSASLEFFRVGTPTRVSLEDQVSGGGVGSDVGPGLLYVGTGEVYDLASSPLLATLNGNLGYDQSFACPYGATRFEDTLVQATGTQPYYDGGLSGAFLQVVDLADVVDRDAGSAWSSTSDSYQYAFATGTRATSVQAYGNYLVAAELRSTGLYLELFDARKLRSSRRTGTLTSSDSLGSYRFSTTVDDYAGYLGLSIYNGMAVVTYDQPSWPGSGTAPSSLNGAGAWIVDLRSALRDSTLSMGPVMATLQATNARSGVLHWNGSAYDLYLATQTGLAVLDVTTAIKGTTLGSAASPANAQVGFVTIADADSLAVWGSYALVGPQASSTGYITAVDVSTPSSPTVVGQLPVSHTIYAECSPNYANAHTSIRVQGSHAYFSAQAYTAVVNLR